MSDTFLLTQDQKRLRIIFAQNHYWERWDRTIFIDECKVSLFQGKKYCWQKKGRSIRNAKPKHPQQVNLCGAITFQGPTRLYLFEQNLDGRLYKRILASTILPSAQNLYERNFKLRPAQDGDSKHRGFVVRDYLKNRRVNVIEDWSVNSPDLNPIENCWAILKDHLSKKKPQPKTLSQLKTAIRTIWRAEITVNICNDLVNSMFNRLKRVIELNGDRIGY